MTIQWFPGHMLETKKMVAAIGSQSGCDIGDTGCPGTGSQ